MEQSGDQERLSPIKIPDSGPNRFYRWRAYDNPL